MKKILFMAMVLIGLASCKKEDIKPVGPPAVLPVDTATYTLYIEDNLPEELQPFKYWSASYSYTDITGDIRNEFDVTMVDSIDANKPLWVWAEYGYFNVNDETYTKYETHYDLMKNGALVVAKDSIEFRYRNF